MKILNRLQVLSANHSDLPLLTLSFNYRNFLSSAINIRRGSHYNHLMWMYEPGKFASQGVFFQSESIAKYTNHHRLKFWSNPDWTDTERKILINAIKADLNKPKWKTRYDVLAILGQALGLGFIQNPLTKICSDYGGYLRKVDSDYSLKHPAPDEVNTWLARHTKYEVFGRYISD